MRSIVCEKFTKAFDYIILLEMSSLLKPTYNNVYNT